MTGAEEYANKVISGEILAGKYIIKACERFLSDLKREDIFFDEIEANRPINFIEKYLCHWEGKWRGKPIILELWQKFIVQQIFGWKKPNGNRRIKSVYIQIARKNSKTTLAAAIALYHIFIDTENTPQVLVGANNEDQAKICVNSAGRIIENSPRLKHYITNGQVNLYEYKKTVTKIAHIGRQGEIRAMSKVAGTKDGFNPSAGIVDEYHEAEDDSLLNVIESGQGARENPILLVATTAGFNKVGPCYSKLRHVSTRILEGLLVDDSHLAIIYEQDEKDDWKDTSTYIKSNPNLGVSVVDDYLPSRLQKAINEGGTKEVEFKTKNLNQWTDSAKTWIPSEAWAKRVRKDIDLKGKKCFGGLDLSSVADICSFALIFPLENGDVYLKLFFWVPEDKVEQRKEKGIPYEEWVANGFMFKTPGNVTDYNFIKKKLIELKGEYDIQGISFDRWNASQLVIDLTDEGFKMTPFGQGFKDMSTPTKEFETRVIAKETEETGQVDKLYHDGNPVMAWMMGNVMIEIDPHDNIKISKKVSKDKVDGPVSSVMALGEKLTHIVEPTPSVMIW
jgi:phage terminase large subunit-like protein